MSFNLPRNPKDLRFTGELRAAVEEQPKSKLGIPRSKKTPQPGRSAHAPDVYEADPIPTPFSPPPIASFDIGEEDDSPTTMLDRDGLDVVAGGFAAVGLRSAGPQAGGLGAPRPKPGANIATPVPNFRQAATVPKVIVAPDPPKPVPPEPKTPPLAFWIVAALVLGVVSYRVAPIAVMKADVVVRSLR